MYLYIYIFHIVSWKGSVGYVYFCTSFSPGFLNNSSTHQPYIEPHISWWGKKDDLQEPFQWKISLGLPNQGMARTLWASATPGDDVNVGIFFVANWDGRDREIWFQVANQDTGWWLNQPI